ncbi:hypothetical protein B0H10DRAFT_1997788 [Mycena sp. CBHHK59/15]|nr:hypothetical protein B0H10DRAFT_1997788 [Mycena sp. CBHHK59/15]
MITVRQICHYRDTFSRAFDSRHLGKSRMRCANSPLRQSNSKRLSFPAPWSDGGYGFGVHWQARASVSPVDYYSIDFGLSITAGRPRRNSVLGIFGQDKTVPELSDTVPCVDIYQLGNGFVDLIKKYTSMAHLESLAASLTRLNPDERNSDYELVLASGSSGNHLADPHESVLKDVNSLTISDE